MREGRLCAAAVAVRRRAASDDGANGTGQHQSRARLAVDRQGAIGEIYAALGATVLSYLQWPVVR